MGALGIGILLLCGAAILAAAFGVSSRDIENRFPDGISDDHGKSRAFWLAGGQQKEPAKLRATAPARFTDHRMRIAREGEPFPD